MQAAVIVLGDLGRSPRMQYHAHSLAASEVHVDLIGETGTPLPAHVSHPWITEHRLPPRRGMFGVPGSAIALVMVLARIPRPDVILVQTPPAIPTIVVAWCVARARGSRLVLDWHNLGWTVLAGRLTATHLLVRGARAIEVFSARLATAHLAVSDALARHLRASLGLKDVSVCRDRPWHAFRVGLRDESTRVQVLEMAGLPPKAEPAIVISPTSWTRDEDTDLVIAAADALEETWAARGPTDGLLIVLSGRGPGREAFERRFRSRSPRRVRIVTTFVDGDRYPALLAAANAGLSLHRSSSGLDLPMKINDLFGTALPVCALDYGQTLRELVDPSVDTMLFRDAAGLAACFDELFCDWPAPTTRWQELRRGAEAAAARPRWLEGWNTEARDVLIPQAARV